MFHKHNFWEPFGDDRAANAAAQDALQPAAELARARKLYDQIAPGNHRDEADQRDHVERLSVEFDVFAHRSGVDRALFRETLQRKLRNDNGGLPNLTPLAPASQAPDMELRRLEGDELDLRHKLEATAKRLASAERIFGEDQQAHLAAERALRDYRQAQGAQA